MNQPLHTRMWDRVGVPIGVLQGYFDNCSSLHLLLPWLGATSKGLDGGGAGRGTAPSHHRTCSPTGRTGDS